MSRPIRVLLGVSGGIAAYKAPELVRRLRDGGCQVRCVLTRAATAFVSPLALEVVTGHRVYGEDYLEASGRAVEEHVEAAEWCEVLLAAPATAHLLARLAHGLADDFLTTTALATAAPWVLAPAMHWRMWEHPATRENVTTLQERGTHLVGPVEGPLASGESGWGRLAEPAEILAAVRTVAGHGSWRGRKVLVTAGPTWEPIDPVRFLGNRSSGRMGFAVAAEAAARGAEVTLVAGPVSLPTPPGVTDRRDVQTTAEMRDAVLEAARTADVVVMSAAVSDFRPRESAATKLKKADGVPRLELVGNPDILSELAEASHRALVVGFAAETGEVEAEARRKLEGKGLDLVVANDVSRSDIGFGSDANEVTVLRREGEPIHLSRRPKRQVAADLLDLVDEELERRR